jgi:enolase-phosphatase E1
VNPRPAPAAILTDIEGTTTPIAFVHEVLFPYAQARLPEFLAAHAGDSLLHEIPEPRLETLLGWMARDEKVTVLKTIQGMIWEAGYAAGEITSELYPDVGPALRRWARAGLRLYVYSSGSVPAQKLLFRHAAGGDFETLFQGFFDTRVGPKRDAASYAGIARGANVPAAEFLFLSDIAAELDAAAQAGFQTCQLVRPRDGTQASASHETAADFAEVARKFALPGG